MKNLRLLFKLMSISLLIFGCNKENNETGNNNPPSYGYDGIIVTELDSTSGYNYAVISEEGEKMCIKTDSDGNAMQAIYTDVDNNSIIVYGKPDGTPTMMIIDGYTFMFDNFNNGNNDINGAGFTLIKTRINK